MSLPPNPHPVEVFRGAQQSMAYVTSKNQFRWFLEAPCGACLLGEGLTINGLRYRRSCPFPQTPIPLRFFDVPNNQWLTLPLKTSFAGF